MSGVRRVVRLTGARRAVLCAVAVSAVLLTPDAAHAARWTITPTPGSSVSLLTPSSLTGVSCPTATMCIAVGSTPKAELIEEWNGSSWSSLPTPTVAGATLTGVSCPTPAMCMAVGSIGSGQTTGPVAELWNGSAGRQLRRGWPVHGIRQ